MTDAPASALAAAEQAIIAAATDFGHDDIVCGSSRQFARAALEAAAPLLAEAWGVTERKRQSGQLYAEHARSMRELENDGWAAPVPPEGKD